MLYLTNLKNHFQSIGCFLIRLSNSATMISFAVALFSQAYFPQYSLSTSIFSISMRNVVSSISITNRLVCLCLLSHVQRIPDGFQVVRGQRRIIRSDVLKGFSIRDPDLKRAHHDAQLQRVKGLHVIHLQSNPPSAGSCRPWWFPARQGALRA